jgi:rod shape-determining protein MreB
VASMFSDLFSHDLAIDLGTANTLVHVKGQGIVIREPSVVALNSVTNEVQAVGEKAKQMLGRAPANIIAIRPIKDGVIAHFEVTEKMLRHFIDKAKNNKKTLFKPRVVVAVPSGITQVEKRAVRDSAESAGASEVYLMEEPMAAAIGVGLPVQEPTGNMIIDIGGGTTEVAIISMSGVVYSKSIRIAGDEMDEAIVNYIKRKYNLLIGERTAEQVKIEIGSAYPLEERLTKEVKGRDLVAGIPKTLIVTDEEIREALTETFGSIVEAVKIALERTPPELAADIVDKGVVVSGGGSLIKGLDTLLKEATGLPITLADDPLSAVANGAGYALDNAKLLKKVTL